MTDTRQATWTDWVGADVVDRDGDKIGKLQNVYMDRATGQPEWLAVSTGMFGRNETFVPIDGVDADGDALKAPYEKAFVKDAPNVDPDAGFISNAEESRLYEYYGREYQAWSDTDRDAQDWDQHDTSRGAGHDTSGPDTDSAMTRSEEEVDVGTRDREAGRARLRKYVVTENVTTTVPVRKEKLRVEREPITDGNVGKAMEGPDISDEEHEVVLNEEEVVVDKKVVPKERVRAEKDVEVEDREVTEQVRKEKVEVEGDARGGTRG
ncbi:DUF2382 domain-containing protein [Iamia sp. SCSIO 61187]|uniref:DUF2382 domain-containing protein n=1 Tax=Iamia sp. SCSIO 61187 TaxID=2722752 RepID=UPI001C632627|nr:DUF2382 domain-containing protein [Iamia sp. SCSIO 61187]QYG94936.1 DUF2382 domain-containing protein [Iamia sp. SCSIO 61187]